MYITDQINYNEILSDSGALEDLASQVFMDLVHPFNYLSRAAQILHLLEEDHHGRREIASVIKACHRQIEQATSNLANQVKALEGREGISQKFDDFYAGYGA